MRPDQHQTLLKWILGTLGLIAFILFLACNSTGKPPSKRHDLFLSKEFGLVRRAIVTSSANSRGLQHVPRKITFHTKSPSLRVYLLDLSHLDPLSFVERMQTVTAQLEQGRPPAPSEIIRQGDVTEGTLWKLSAWPWSLSHPNYLLLVTSPADAELSAVVSYGRD